MAKTANRAAPNVLRLAAVVTIRDIAALRDATLALLGTGMPAVLECSAVEKADLSLVQLLVAVQRMAERDACRLDLVIPAGGVVAELIRHSGLEQEFDTTGAANEQNHPLR